MRRQDELIAGKRQRIAARFAEPQPDFSEWQEAADKKEAEEIARAVKERTEAEAKAIENAKIGEVMPDGTIYAGISPNTGKHMYVTAKDSSISMDFNTASEYAKNLDEHGHKDWRLPTKEELNVLFENREKGALKETFNLTGEPPAGFYWSSTPCSDYAYVQRFDDGIQDHNFRHIDSSVRCIR